VLFPVKKLLDTITLVLMDWKTFLEKGNGSPKLQTGLTLTPVSKGSGWTDISINPDKPLVVKP
jgi:hypothetical protein